MLHIHRLLAEAVGVEKNHTFILKNGEVVDIVNGVARQTRDIPAGDTYVDGIGIGEVGEVVLRDRKRLSEDGMLVIVLTISKYDGSIITNPDTISRGFVYEKNSEELIQDIIEILKAHPADKIFEEKISGKSMDRPKLKEMLDYVREGDTVYVSEFSRLARSTQDLSSRSLSKGLCRKSSSCRKRDRCRLSAFPCVPSSISAGKRFRLLPLPRK